MLHLLLVIFTFVELNCENLFDTNHDEGKNDYEYLPSSDRRWTPRRYWKKIQHTAQTITACGNDSLGLLPDMAILTEVENDTVMRDLTRRSVLRGARYEYVMTDSPDQRGIDIALLYSPFTFRLINHHSIGIATPEGQRPTRDILYASGLTASGDTLHVFGIHAPSRSGGELKTRSYRLLMARRLCQAVDSINAVCNNPMIIIAGDFNDYSGDPSLRMLTEHGLTDISDGATGTHEAKGTYRYRGEWGSLDHIFCSKRLAELFTNCRVNDAAFLLEKDKKYGGKKPRRTYLGPRYLGGYSDHLPLVAGFDL